MAEAIIRGVAYAFDDDGPRRPTLPVRNMEAELNGVVVDDVVSPSCQHCGVEMPVKRGPQTNYFCAAAPCQVARQERVNVLERARYHRKAGT